MRAVVLVTTRPGGGPDVVDAVKGDKRFLRALATFDPCEAVLEVNPVDRTDLWSRRSRASARW